MAQLDLHRRVLRKCQTHFLQVVAVNEVYRELYKKHVIHQNVQSKITNSRSVQDARGHLFDHMRDYGTLDTLKVFCDVIASEEYNGFQAMQDFGKLIKDMLEQEATGCVQGPDSSRNGNAEGMTTSLDLAIAQLDLHRRVLRKCQTHFLQVVAVKQVYRELCERHVIHQTVESEIKSLSVEEARGHLFDHMREYGTLDTLNIFCDVITSEKYNGIRAMQDLGKEIKDMLEQEAATSCGQGPGSSRKGNEEGMNTSLGTGGGGGGGDAPQSSLSACSMQASGKRQVRANLVQVIQNDADFSETFLEEMNAEAVGQTLKSLRLISPEVATDIARARSKKEANNVLLQHMLEDADEKKLQKILEVSSKAEGYGRMNNFAASVLRNQQ